MQTIAISRGYSTTIDDNDYEWVTQWKWSALGEKGVYARRTGKRANGKRANLYLHRELMVRWGHKIEGKWIDHKDRNTLNNRRANLRIATPAQSCQNTIRGHHHKRSKYRGIQQNTNNKWQAVISQENKRRCLGTFSTEEQAARAYDNAARKLHGEFAVLNFPTEEI